MNSIFSKTAKLMLCCSFLCISLIANSQIKWEYYLIDAITQKPIVGLEVSDFKGNTAVTNEAGYFQLVGDGMGLKFSDLGYFMHCPNCVPNVDTTYVNWNTWYVYPAGFYTLKAIQIGQNENVRSELQTTSTSKVILGNEGRFSFDGASLQPAFNSIAGVQYDTRGYGGSSRISIRGSFIRSPFAVRNVKMYLDGIALTNPDGQSPIEMLDLSFLSQMEVTKGPAGPQFGSGHGGVIQLALPAISRNYIQVTSGGDVGDFGYRKGYINAQGSYQKLSYGFSVNSQTTGGYRQQEWNYRENIFGYLNWKGKANHKFIFLHYRGGWGLPGALTESQVNANPTQAVPFAIENNTSVYKWRDMIGYTLNKKWKSQSIQYSANAYSSDKWNAYGTNANNSGDKSEMSYGGGMRFIHALNFDLGKNISLQNQIGGETQFEYLDFYETTLSNGVSGDTKFMFESYALHWNVFNQLSLMKKDEWNVHAAIGTNATPTVLSGASFIPDPPFQDLDSRTNYELKIYPRIGAAYRLNKHFYATGNWTKGNSAPSLFEQFDYNTNSFNTLASEYSNSIEMGVKGSWQDFQFTTAVYSQAISNAIAVADTVIDGLPRSFVNSNGMNQRGLEWQANYAYHTEHLGLNVWTNGTWMAFEYATSAQGNRLPGVPLSQFNNGLSVDWIFDRYAAKTGFQLVHQWSDKTPLNNQNTQWAAARNVVNLDWFLNLPVYRKTNVSEGLGEIVHRRLMGSIGIHLGSNNLTNTVYTSFYQVNGFGGRYFNPMPFRNYYAGLAIHFML